MKAQNKKGNNLMKINNSKRVILENEYVLDEEEIITLREAYKIIRDICDDVENDLFSAKEDNSNFNEDEDFSIRLTSEDTKFTMWIGKQELNELKGNLFGIVDTLWGEK